MNTRTLVLLGIALVCTSVVSLSADDRMDIALQRLLHSYGVDMDIVRPCTVLKEKSDRSDGRFLFVFDGKPGVEILLDRDYWVLAPSQTEMTDDVSGFMFKPIDGQSALTITTGNDIHERPDKALAADPGFTGVTREKGVVADQKVVWRRWQDEKHLYSDCTLNLVLRSAGKDKVIKVNIIITADSGGRRIALESCMASLRLREAEGKSGPPNQAPLPTTKAVAPAAGQRPSQP